MQFQDLDPTRKLPFIRSSTTKILVLVAVVVLLITANFFVIFRGKAGNSSEISTVTGTVGKTDATATQDVTVYDINKDESVVVLVNFLKYLKAGNKTEAEKLISVYSSSDFFQAFMSEIISREDVTFNPVGYKYSQQKNFSYITMEISKGSSKEYYKFVLIKNNSKWEIVSFEKI